jgi:hypothetical protein
MIVVIIPFISVAFAVFIYFDTKTTIKKRHESVAQLEVELNQLQLEQEVKLQHVLNPLEQSQFLSIPMNFIFRNSLAKVEWG